MYSDNDLIKLSKDDLALDYIQLKCKMMSQEIDTIGKSYIDAVCYIELVEYIKKKYTG